jgi:hypothetical protein
VARKDLSRTVIEGGRYYRNKLARRASHGEERASTRAWLDRVTVDIDEADETSPRPRTRVPKQFYDKLAPAQRWLVAQVGRPWSVVYAELRERFDTRTIAGRHVVNDHMLQWVRRHGDDEWRQFSSRFELVIDVHGILRKTKWFGRSFGSVRREVLAWANGRVCALTYRGWWWFRLESVGAPCATPWRCSHANHHDIGSFAYHAYRAVADGPMTRKQVAYLDSLPAGFRSQLVIPSPMR